MKIVIDISSCRECPFFKTGNQWSTDGFDNMEDWICTKINRKIQGSVEWHEEKGIRVPKWCPSSIDRHLLPPDVYKKVDENDPYYLLKSAHKNGETIQVKRGDAWIDLSPLEVKFDSPVNYYKIKENENI
jgi:hypothetical protein